MHPESLRSQVAAIDWWHTMDLGHGVVTPGRDRTARKLSSLALPASFAGQTVLDIGAWDGFFSFEAERRGADRVLAVDRPTWSRPGGKDGFELARRALGSKVEDRTLDLADLRPDDPGVFDVVLLLGVLYHLPDPFTALARVAAVTGRLLVLETHGDLLASRRPAAAFYESDELKGDPSNWWGPNVAAVRAMLRAVGFESVEARVVTPAWQRAARTVVQPWQRRPSRRLAGRGPWAAWNQGRIVAHATKAP